VQPEDADVDVQESSNSEDADEMKEDEPEETVPEECKDDELSQQTSPSGFDESEYLDDLCDLGGRSSRKAKKKPVGNTFKSLGRCLFVLLTDQREII
jgi:hypothetical protein